MMQKLEALHLEALCEEVRTNHNKICFAAKFQKNAKPLFITELVDFLCPRICNCEFKNTPKWKQLILFSSWKINWSGFFCCCCFYKSGLFLVFLFHVCWTIHISIKTKQSKLCFITLRNVLHIVPSVFQTQAEREQLPVRAGTLAKLQSHIDSIILSLPEDLQGILHKPATPWPPTQALLQKQGRDDRADHGFGVWRFNTRTVPHKLWACFCLFVCFVATAVTRTDPRLGPSCSAMLALPEPRKG